MNKVNRTVACTEVKVFDVATGNYEIIELAGRLTDAKAEKGVKEFSKKESRKLYFENIVGMVGYEYSMDLNTFINNAVKGKKTEIVTRKRN